MAQIVSSNFSPDPFVLSSYQVTVISNFSKKKKKKVAVIKKVTVIKSHCYKKVSVIKSLESKKLPL